MPVSLFVGNLPYNATEGELRELFSAVGALLNVYLPTDRESGKLRGFAFIEFSERAHAEEAFGPQQSVTLMNRTNATHAMTHAHAGAAFHFACAMTRSIQKSANAIGGIVRCQLCRRCFAASSHSSSLTICGSVRAYIGATYSLKPTV